MRRAWVVLIAAASIIVAVPYGATAAEPSIERTAPYDFGEPNGTLVGASVPCVTVTNSIPPFPRLCQLDAGTSTGIYVDTSERARVTITATIRNIGPIDPPERLWACFGYRPPDSSITFGGFDCTVVPSVGEQSTITTQLEDSASWGTDGIDPGRHAFSVFLSDRDNTVLNVRGPNAVEVEKIVVNFVSA